jgi:hypothetical protein
MDLLDGFASRVRSSAEIGGDDVADDDDLVPRARSPQYVVRFELSEREVALSSLSPVAIAEGDRVRVAGRFRAGAFDALAYRNESTLAEGDRGWWPTLALSMILTVIGLGMLVLNVGGPRTEPVPLGLGGALVAAGLIVGYRGLRVLAARNLLRRHAD